MGKAVILILLSVVFITVIGLAVESDKGKWTKKIDMVIPRGIHAAAVVCSEPHFLDTYLIGGYT
jgi:hypothetical protein